MANKFSTNHDIEPNKKAVKRIRSLDYVARIMRVSTHNYFNENGVSIETA